MGQFVQILTYKDKNTGNKVVLVNYQDTDNREAFTFR